MDNKASIHSTQPGKQSGFGDLLRLTAQAGRPLPVIYSVNGNLIDMIRQESPSTKLIYRRQTETFNRLPNGFYQGNPAQNAIDWITGTKDPTDRNRTLMQNWKLNPADWYDPLNEPVLQLPPNPTAEQVEEEIRKAKWLNTWMLTALEIAATNNVSLALFSFPTGGPSLELWYFLCPSLREGKKQQAILSLHEYSISGSLQNPEPGNVFRYREVWKLLPEDCRLPIVVSECGAGNGFNAGLSGQAWVDDLMWYNEQTCQDLSLLGHDPLLGFCAYQLGGDESNMVDVLPMYEAAISSFSCPEEEEPLESLDNTTIPPASEIVDSSHHRWTFGSPVPEGYLILKDGVQFAGGQGSLLLYYSRKVYTQNHSGMWFVVEEEEGRWVRISGDPRVTVEPFWVSWPLRSSEAPRITSRFNDPRSYANHLHEGIDGDAYENSISWNSTVVAAQDGIVEYVSNRPGRSYGIHIVIRHPWGNELERYRTLYGHLSLASVTIGQVVKRGDQIGISGNSGTTAIHLHFNVHDAVAGLKGYFRCPDCSERWPDGVIDPETVIRWEEDPIPSPLPPENPIPTTSVQFGLGYGTQSEMTQAQIDFYGSVFGTAEHASFKFLTMPDSDVMTRMVQKVRAKNPTAFLGARIFFSVGDRPFTPTEFIDFSHNGVSAAYAQGIRDFEIHNEPNLPSESAGTWTNGVAFGNWLRDVVIILKSRYPEIRCWFPGLSPNGGAQRFLADALSTKVGSYLYGYCFHAYWHTVSGGTWNMVDETGGFSWKNLWRVMPLTERIKPIWLSEFSNNSPAELPITKGHQYQDYQRMLPQHGVSVASSFVLYWDNDFDHENWVTVKGGSTGIKEGFLS